MNERLIQFLSAENISQAQFADSINVARAGVSHIVAGRNKPGWDFIINTMTRYPTLNIEWLLTGKGKMYKGTSAEGLDDATKTRETSRTRDYTVEQPDENTLFGDYGYTGTGKYGGYETELAELEATIHHLPRSNDEGGTQPFKTIAEAMAETQDTGRPVPQTSAKPANQPAPQPASQISPQTVVKRPNVAKVIVFFDDGTFQECK